MGEHRRATPADVGKTLLVGIVYVDADDNETRRTQHIAVVTGVRDDGMDIRWENGQDSSLPPEVRDAPPGTYTLRSTGQQVNDPDLLATWRFTEDSTDADAADAESSDHA